MKPRLLSGLALALVISLVRYETHAREWTSASGVKMEAELVSFKDGKALLKKPNGKTMEVALEKFSKADREFLEASAEPKPEAQQKLTELDAAIQFKKIGSLAGTPHASAAYPTYNKKAVLIKPGVAVAGTELNSKLKELTPTDEKEAIAAAFCALNRLIKQEHKGKYVGGIPRLAYDSSGAELMEKVIYLPVNAAKIIKVSEKDLGLAPGHSFPERMTKVDEYAAKKLKAAGLPTGEKMQDEKDPKKTLIEIIVIDSKSFTRVDSD